jgi:imidazolonepropionase-like amidohydrolase
MFRSLLMVLMACGAGQGAPAANPLAITHVTVIDGTDPAPRFDQTVVVRDRRIVAVGPAPSTAVPPGSRVLNGRGRFLIPGLWDMHVHTDVPAGREVLRLYVENGVLSVRDMAGTWARLSAWRREIAAGSLTGPRIMASGPYLEGGEIGIAHLLARTPDEARAAVDSLSRLGVDLVKLHGQLTRETWFAALRAARERGLRSGGHVPRSVTAAEASDSGLGSLEHLLQIPIPCTPAESLALAPRFPIQGMLGRCTSADLAPLFARLVRNGTAVVPTQVAAYEISHWPLTDLPGDAYARHLPDTLRRFVTQIFQIPPGVPADAHRTGQALFAKRLALVGAMHRAGVVLLAGTDAPLRNSPPGFGLHEELALLVRAGLSPFAALRAATLAPARWFGMQDSLGTVAPGQLADLVLLDADPLADIRNLRGIRAVVQQGRVVRRR